MQCVTIHLTKNTKHASYANKRVSVIVTAIWWYVMASSGPPMPWATIRPPPHFPKNPTQPPPHK